MQPQKPTTPWVHCLAAAYLALPVLIWLPLWLKPWLGIPAAAALAWALWSSQRPYPRMVPPPPPPPRQALVIAAVALVWVGTTAAGGLLDTANGDWYKHRFLLHGLAERPWPVLATLDGDVHLLRYSIGWHIVPAAAAKVLGSWALPLAVAAWTALGAGLVLALVTEGQRRWCLAAGLLVFVLFSGMDAARIIASNGWEPGLDTLRRVRDLEWTREARWLIIEYPGMAHAFSYAPQHLLPAALGALLLWRRAPASRAGPWLVSTLLWSPYSALGLLPLLAGAAASVRSRARDYLCLENAAAVIVALLLVLYLTVGSGSVPGGWIWSGKSEVGLVIVLLVIFVAAEFGVLAALLAALDWRSFCRPMAVAALSVLPTLPLLRHGDLSEFATRASFPSLVILAMLAIGTLTAWTPSLPWRKHALTLALVAVLAVGSLGAGVTVQRALAHAAVVGQPRDPAWQFIPARVSYQYFTDRNAPVLDAILR